MSVENVGSRNVSTSWFISEVILSLEYFLTNYITCTISGMYGTAWISSLLAALSFHFTSSKFY